MTTYMSLTRENVADLREGDVVRYSGHRTLHGSTIEGPLYEHGGVLLVGPSFVIRLVDGGVYGGQPITIEVVSRAPRPFYTNVDHTVRAEPFVGDVVRDADEGRDTRFWMWCEDGTWCESTGAYYAHRKDLPPKNLLLILDGATGEPPA